MISYCGYNQVYSLVLNSVKLAARSMLHRAAAKPLLGKIQVYQSSWDKSSDDKLYQVPNNILIPLLKTFVASGFIKNYTLVL